MPRSGGLALCSPSCRARSFYAGILVAERLISVQWPCCAATRLPWCCAAVAMPAGPPWRWAGRLMLVRCCRRRWGGYLCPCGLVPLVFLPAAACAACRTARHRVLSGRHGAADSRGPQPALVIPALSRTSHTSPRGRAASPPGPTRHSGRAGQLANGGRRLETRQASRPGMAAALVLWMALALAALAGYLAFARDAGPAWDIAAVAVFALACIWADRPRPGPAPAMIEFWPGPLRCSGWSRSFLGPAGPGRGRRFRAGHGLAAEAPPAVLE